MIALTRSRPKSKLRSPGPAAPLRRSRASTDAAPTAAPSAGPGASPRDEAILAEPRGLSHAEVYRRVSARGVKTTLATVARVRRAAYGHREAGRPAEGLSPYTDRARLLLATLGDVCERHDIAPEDAVVYLVATLDREPTTASLIRAAAGRYTTRTR